MLADLPANEACKAMQRQSWSDKRCCLKGRHSAALLCGRTEEKALLSWGLHHHHHHHCHHHQHCIASPLSVHWFLLFFLAPSLAGNWTSNGEPLRTALFLDKVHKLPHWVEETRESTQHRVQQTNSYLLRAKQTQVKTQRSVHATLPASSDCNQAHSISHPLTWHPLAPAEPNTRPQHHQQHKQQQQKLWMAFFAAIGLTRMHWASIAAGRQCHQIGIKVKSTK